MTDPTKAAEHAEKTAELSGKIADKAEPVEEELKRGEKAKRKREARQSEALRDNLRRRKAQTRGRRQKSSLMDD